MAMTAKLLMDVFYNRAKEYKTQGEYNKGFIFDSCENMVNNFLHGRPFAETAQLTRAVFEQNAGNASLDQEERDAYTEAVTMLDAFVAEHAA
jgi:hypothetical protein